MESPSITAAIAAFAADRTLHPPPSALDVARLSLVDWAAVALAGLGEPVATITRDLVGEEAGAAQATVLGLGRKVPARAAALANGALSHALDYDDTHFAYVGHPSVAVFPAAFAMAERQGASGAAFLEAALIGMEAACRIGHWLGTRHYNHGFHQTATSGAFGAAMAAGRLLCLDEDRLRHALGIVATRASGLKSQFGTMGKPYNAGTAAANGVEAALLAARGFISRPDGLECGQGFAETHAGEAVSPESALAGLGRDFWFEAVQHKFHACCHGLHASLEALIHLRQEAGFSAERVSAVQIRVNPRWLRVCDLPAPRTGLEAKFSYRLTSAMALAGRSTAALDTYSEASCADPDLLRLRDRVRVEGDAAIRDTAASVQLTFTDNRSREAFFDLDTPMEFAARHTRIEGKVHALLPADEARAVMALFDAPETASAAAMAEAIGRAAIRLGSRA
ncbi:MAG: MmgE/PrpD family protein [Beijerinckiaceae bacterium]|nr:MmgE/PrpD family protein [Beijerinckiaceae bacterium]MCZ8301577.1 MmgE/PrpD family protein [Beijerinckiaceae bacterium]